MEFDESTLQVQVTNGCYYLPPIELLFRWLNFSRPATMIEHYCESKGIEPPKLSHNTINRAATVRPSVSLRSMDTFKEWLEGIFAEQLGETFSSPVITEPGYVGLGALSWLGNLPHLKQYWGDDVPYTLEVIEALIHTEKNAIGEALDSELSAEERVQLIYQNPKVKLLFNGFEFHPKQGNKSNRIASIDSRSVALLIGINFLYFIASWDAEYSLSIDPENAEKGILRSILPDTYTQETLHTACWEKLKQHAIRQGKITGTWNEISSQLYEATDPDSARRTLNRYKCGEVEISDENLAELVRNIFGSGSEKLCIIYLLRSKATWLLSRMFDELKKETPNLTEADIEQLLAMYHEYFEHHLKALRGRNPES